jgi:tetratricopeptide (TPR) repeat protein
LETDENNLIALKDLAMILHNNHNTKKALELTTRAVQKEPMDPRILYTMACVLHYDRQYEEAIKYCNKVLAIDPNDKDTRNLLAWSVTCSSKKS